MSISTEREKRPFADLINGDIPVLIDFYADWCAPCKMMTPILQDVKKALGDELIIIKIDSDKYPEVANRYQVRGIPNLVLIQNGQVIWQKAGVIPASQLISDIKSILKN